MTLQPSSLSFGHQYPVLMVMDMQEAFVQHFMESSVDDGYKEAYKKLRANILQKMTEVLEQNGYIFIVELRGFGDIIEEILALIQQHTGKIFTFSKSVDDILSYDNLCSERVQSESILYRLKHQNIPLPLVGLNTGFCIKDSGITMHKFGLSVSIPLGYTLNLDPSTFQERNDIAWNRRAFGKYWDIVHYGEKGEEKQLLTDYV